MTRQKAFVSNQTCILQTSTQKYATQTPALPSDLVQNAIETNTKLQSSLSSVKKNNNNDNDKEVDKIPFRIWKQWPDDVAFPCVPGESNYKLVKTQRSPADSGLLFTREMKTGSSTVAGILLRLAHDKGATMLPKKHNLGGGSNGVVAGNTVAPCRLRIDHSSASKMGYAHRDKKRSFLISLLRDPTKRAISHFFHFRVSQQKIDPTDENFKTFYQNDRFKWSNYYTKDLAMRPIDIENESAEKLVKDIIKEYNFIAITERMDESLVVFKMLLDLRFEDILYMSAKQHGSFTAGPKDRPCIYLTPSFVTDGMKEFFASNYWKDYVRVDELLYKSAIKSLDQTIDALGREQVQNEVKVFQQAKEYAQAKCFNRTIYRCNFKGESVGSMNSTCYMWDIGCGYECLNEISVERDVLNS